MGGEQTMDRAHFEHRRTSGFPTVRRGGYDPDEVDRFLASVSEWLRTEAAEELGDGVVQSKLEQVGQTTARILMRAEQENEELRRSAEEECADLRAKARIAAEEEAAELRRATEDECADLRAQAEADAQRMIDDAAVQAHRALQEETERLRADMDAVVAELDRRRSVAVEEVERLRADLLDAISPHSEPSAPTEREGRTAGRRQVPAYGPSRHANA
jgi:DivIVA domain-containing protein